MKKHIYPVICLVICLVCSIVLVVDSYKKGLKDIGLPSSQYQLLCSPEGKYGLVIPSKRGERSFNSTHVWPSAKEAKEFAWYWEKHKNDIYIPEADKYQWKVCE